MSQDDIVWPAYLKAHRPLFKAGDVERGHFDDSVISGVELLEASNLSMDEILDKACDTIWSYVKAGKRASDWPKP